ncbi:MAG TPA: hypothetical protein VKP30_15245 [Polyangiaceae bacterium]|nr:hypothetical protein [Polyangiaceae bacterium]
MSEPDTNQLQLLSDRVEALQRNQVTREEFDELRRLIQRLADRIDQIAPENEIPDEHLAIMSAVFAATIGKRFKIKNVQLVGETSGWTQAGRVNLHAQRHVMKRS